MTRHIRLGLTSLAVLAALVACGSSKRSSALSMQVPRVDEREVALSADQAATDGNLRLTPLAVECGITYLIGTHAEVDFKGQLCRFRLAIQNVDNTFHHFDSTIQRLVDTTGRTIAPDTAAMEVKRRSPTQSLGQLTPW
ncbi:MAG: hypothetical protein JWN96_13 [Mycobacterium sp.]|nr:hypothetical protein [Mycobacterium sp.]